MNVRMPVRMIGDVVFQPIYKYASLDKLSQILSSNKVPTCLQC